MIRLFASVSLSLPLFLFVIGPTLTEAQLEGRPSLYKKWLQTSSAGNVPNDNNRKRSIKEARAADSYAIAESKCDEYSRYADALSATQHNYEQPSISSFGKFPLAPAIGLTFSNDKAYGCTGVAISPRFFLTAAHCPSDTYLFYFNAAEFWFGADDWNLNTIHDIGNMQIVRIMETIRHPSYKPGSQYHDIAILKLERDIYFNEWARPLCLPYSLPDNATLEVADIGLDFHNSKGERKSSYAMLKTIAELVCPAECNDIYRRLIPHSIVVDWQLCARQKKPDVCVIASGPLVSVNNNHPHVYSLIGIASLGSGCEDPPVIYTRVYPYIPWIQRIVWPNL